MATVRELPATAGAPLTYQYRVDLWHLTPGRDYLFEIESGGRVLTEDLRFRTVGAGPVRFLVFGDSGTGNEAQRELARRMAEDEHPSLVLHTGDLSQESGTPEQLDENYLRVYAQLMGRIPFFPTPGNHDYYTDAGSPCFAIHATPASAVAAVDEGRYYSFDWGNVHFISLNSNLMEYPEAAQRMIDWLERDLESQKNFWKVVYFHHTPYPTGHHLNDTISAQMRTRIVPVLERYGVQVVFAGHEHSYQRTHLLKGGAIAGEGGTVYITTGGGGGVLHAINPGSMQAVAKSAHHYMRAEVRGARMTLTAIGLKGEKLDSVTLTAPTNPSIEAVVSAGSYTTTIAPGSLISIFGRDLAPTERTPSTPALELAGTTVTLDGKAIPLLYVSPDQINAHVPYGLAGASTLRVHTRSSTNDLPIEIHATAPAILQVASGARHIPAIRKEHSDSLVTRAAPVQPGDFITIYLTGLGAVRGNIGAGETAPSSPVLHAASGVQVRIGGRMVPAAFAGLTPGFVGLYQVNVQVPDRLSRGPVGLQVVTGGTASDPVTLFVDSVSSDN